jgi:HEAT repeat protein
MIPRKPETDQATAYNAALGEIQKSLKAMTFYPDKHPLREEILAKAYQSVVSIAREGALSLIVRRNGISFADRDISTDKSPMALSLARELFAREIQQLTLLPSLSYNDYMEFIALVAMEPQSIIGRGGLAEILNDKDIHSVVANEIDITAVYTRKNAGAPQEGASPEGESPQAQGQDNGFAQEFEMPMSGEDDNLSDLSMEELLALMEMEGNEDRYSRMASLLPGKGELLKAGGEYDRLFLILTNLLKQSSDDRKKPGQKQYANLVFQQLALGQMVEHLLDHLEEENYLRKEMILTIFTRLGGEVVDQVIRRLNMQDDQYAMKSVTSALARIGTPAVPAVTRLLKGSDWQTVRNGVIILGDMGCREAVSDLTICAYHPEGRVRMEAIRSLAKIGGREATTLLIDMLGDKNSAVQKQSIIWLGITRNDKALQSLLQIATRHDFSGKLHSLKKEALVAIGRIGDRQALEPLRTIVTKRHLISSERAEELKIAAVEAIANLGGDSSREFLVQMEARGGRIGKACSAALKSLGRLTKAHDQMMVEEGAGEL